MQTRLDQPMQSSLSLANTGEVSLLLGASLHPGVFKQLWSVLLPASTELACKNNYSCHCKQHYSI